MIPKTSPKEGLIIEWPATQPEREELQKVSWRGDCTWDTSADPRRSCTAR
jgi:hypothetical protein